MERINDGGLFLWVREGTSNIIRRVALGWLFEHAEGLEGKVEEAVAGFSIIDWGRGERSCSE